MNAEARAEKSKKKRELKGRVNMRRKRGGIQRRRSDRAGESGKCGEARRVKSESIER